MTRFTPLWLQAGSYDATVDRRLVGALWPGNRSSGYAVSSGGTSMVVSVSPGAASVVTMNNTGSVLCVSDNIETVELQPAGPTGQNRYDIVGIYPRAADIGIAGGITDFVITYMSGNYAATPTPPPIPLGLLGLAEIYVPGGSAAVSPANIRDIRPGGLAVGSFALTDPWPRGNVARASGPPTQTDCGAALVIVASLTFTPTVGRRYRIYGEGLAQQQTASSTTSQLTITAAGVNRFVFYTNLVPLAANQWVMGSSFIDLAPATPAAITATIGGQSVTGALRVRANECALSVDDIGAV
jgi:hypothetical protein